MSSSTSTLIIGANRGIGLGLVEKTLSSYPNVVVYATARDVTKADALHKLVKEYPGRLVLIKLDMLDEKSVADAAAELKTHTTTLERIIINAGVLLGQGRIEDLKASDFLDNLNANVVGPHIITKAFSPFLVASKEENKILAYISSVAGSITLASPVGGAALKDMFKADYVPLSGYGTTKAGLNMIGRQWGENLEPQGVSVVLVHPGGVETDMNQGSGLITVKESVTGVLDALEKHKIEDGAKGILTYDGTTIPW